jgi:hypothetical protein
MEQNELIPNQLMHPRGCDTKRILEKKGLKEPKFERSIKAKNGTWFYTKEPFVSEERDQELIEKFLAKTTQPLKIF